VRYELSETVQYCHGADLGATIFKNGAYMNISQDFSSRIGGNGQWSLGVLHVLCGEALCQEMPQSGLQYPRTVKHNLDTSIMPPTLVAKPSVRLPESPHSVTQTYVCQVPHSEIPTTIARRIYKDKTCRSFAPIGESVQRQRIVVPCIEF
jgi:hypothetical protein